MNKRIQSKFKSQNKNKCRQKEKSKSQRVFKSPHRFRLVEPKLLEVILSILELIRDPILRHFPYRIPSPRLGSVHSGIRDLNPNPKRSIYLSIKSPLLSLNTSFQTPDFHQVASNKVSNSALPFTRRTTRFNFGDGNGNKFGRIGMGRREWTELGSNLEFPLLIWGQFFSLGGESLKFLGFDDETHREREREERR